MSTQCPICLNHNVAYTINHKEFPDAKIYFCPDCEHWFASPEPETKWLDSYYKEVYSIARRKFFGDEYYSIMTKRADAQSKFIKRHIGLNEKSGAAFKDKKVLDLGCGIGALVRSFQDQQAIAIGFDSDPVAIDTGRKLWNSNIYLNSASDQNLSESYNILCMSHVVEHFSDIRSALQGIFKSVKPGGYVFVEVPFTCDGMLHEDFDTESHLHFFSKKSLATLLKQQGLQVIVCITCGPPISYGKNAKSIIARPINERIVTRVSGYLSRLIEGKTTTIYDGWYDKYYLNNETNGIWLRCLARKKSEG